MASAKYVLERMIAAMNRGGDASARCLEGTGRCDICKANAQKNPRAEEKPYSPASMCKFQSGEKTS
jgi:hypothetical protein